MRNALTKFFLFLSLAFLLNFLWETLHAIFLYRSLEIGVERYVSLMLRVSLIDMAWLAATFVGIGVYFRNFLWFERLTPKKIGISLVVPFVIAVLIEIKGVYVFHDWAYSQLMPTVIGLGVSPLLQLSATFFFAIMVLKNMSSAGE